MFSNGTVAYYYRHYIGRVHANVSQSHAALPVYSQLLADIEKEAFDCQRLKRLVGRLFKEGYSASQEINHLSTIVRALDFRLSSFIQLPLNLLLFWNIRWVIKAEKWKTRNKEKVKEWLDTIGRIEAYISLSNLQYNHPMWCVPRVSDDYITLEAKDMAHPLISYKDRVSNDFYLTKPGEVAIITGANMSGKSTFLKTIGVNIVLSLAGGPTCAQQFTTSAVLPFTAMQADDSLSAGVSSFKYEINRIGQLIDEVESGQYVFALIDEIFKATNPKDKLAGSQLLLQKLMDRKISGCIATHDLELTQMVDEHPDLIKNYYFDTTLEDDTMYFDYKLREGVTEVTNALSLIKRALRKESN